MIWVRRNISPFLAGVVAAALALSVAIVVSRMSLTLVPAPRLGHAPLQGVVSRSESVGLVGGQDLTPARRFGADAQLPVGTTLTRTLQAATAGQDVEPARRFGADRALAGAAVPPAPRAAAPADQDVEPALLFGREAGGGWSGGSAGSADSPAASLHGPRERAI